MSILKCYKLISFIASAMRKKVEVSPSISLCYMGGAILLFHAQRIEQKRICFLVSLLRGVSSCGVAQLFTAMRSKGILEGGWDKESNHG